MRRLIINADDFGSCLAANKAIEELYGKKLISSATLMTPCKLSDDAIKRAVKCNMDIGVHITLTSEWQREKWRPLCDDCSSLVNSEGHFYEKTSDLYRHARREDVEREIVTQLEYAIKAGCKIHHLDNHMSCLIGNGIDSYLDIAIGICSQYGLSLRAPKKIQLAPNAPKILQDQVDKLIDYASSLNVNMVDYVEGFPRKIEKNDTYETVKATYLNLIKNLKQGITEVFFHPCVNTSKECSFVDDFQLRYWDYLFLQDPDFHELLKQEDITITSHKELWHS